MYCLSGDWITKNKSFKKFKQFSDQIKNCTRKVFNWKPSDLCAKKCDSFWTKIANMRFGPFVAIEQIGCYCGKKFSYKCDENICAKNINSCDAYNSNKNEITKLSFC